MVLLVMERCIGSADEEHGTVGSPPLIKSRQLHHYPVIQHKVNDFAYGSSTPTSHSVTLVTTSAVCDRSAEKEKCPLTTAASSSVVRTSSATVESTVLVDSDQNDERYMNR